ncbi:hypothetical protein [Sediminibacillus albus]|uniref:hypothetical protein n=1 Tax=Sediminibacillus albus TaxID=407036 RepID=UPI0011142DCC|nr:hypothetical protein [Sediminibacillus albus]
MLLIYLRARCTSAYPINASTESSAVPSLFYIYGVINRMLEDGLVNLRAVNVQFLQVDLYDGSISANFH